MPSRWRGGEGILISTANVFLKFCTKVKAADALSICEQKLGLKYLEKKSPFLASFQMKLALLRGLGECIRNERKETMKSKVPRVFGVNKLQSSQFPQLKLLLSIKDGALDILRTFPEIYRILSSTNQEALIINPVTQVCNGLTQLSNQDLFTFWSPRCQPIHRRIDLNQGAIITARSSSDSFMESNDMDWTCSNGGEWRVAFEKPQNISSLRISWVSPALKSSASTGCTAPYRVNIYVATDADEMFSFVATFKPDVEFTSQNSWVQSYPVKFSNVRKLSIVLSNKTCAANKTKVTRMCSCEVMSQETTVDGVDTLQLLQELQFALLPLTATESLAKSAYDAMLSIVRCSGSLGMSLSLVEFIVESGVNNRPEIRSWDSLKALLRSFRAEYDLICGRLKKLYGMETIETSCEKFNHISRSDNCVIGKKDDSVTVPSKSGFCFVGCSMESGIYEWSLCITELGNDPAEEIYFGVAFSSTSQKYQPLTCKEFRGVRCRDGQVVSLGPKRVKPVEKIKANDVCKFRHNVKLGLVQLYINDVYQGIVFEQVAGGCSPVLVFSKVSSPVTVVLTSFCQVETLQTVPASDIPWDFTKDSKEDDDLSSYSAAEVILENLSRLARIKSAEIDQSVRASQSKQCPLEFPFCVEVSAEVLFQIKSLLDRMTSAGIPVAKYLLEILSLQFYCLSLSKLDTADVCLSASQCFKAKHGPVRQSCDLIKDIQATLKQMMKSKDEALELLAVKTFARGLCVYSTTSVEKVDLILEVVTADSSFTNTEVARNALLEMLLAHICNLEDVLNLLNMYGTIDHRPKIELFLAEMIRIAASYSVDPVQSKTIATTLDTVCKVLSSFQQHITYALLTEENSSETAQLLRNLLAHFAKSLLRHGVDLVVSMKESNCKWFDDDKHVRKSLLGQVIHPFIYSLCTPGHDLKFLREITPHLITLTSEITLACGASTACKVAQLSIHSSIRRFVPRATTSGGVGGWRQIKAAFEDSDSSYTVGDGGQTYTAIHSTNTCALLNVKFDATQRAAWEFLLEHDSTADECSVFGAARMPLSSRCYSSSPDLWMRRSYNGYMYCQGRSASNSLEKIHPGDIVRIEFNGKDGTLSYSVNGSDLEVGFTEITDEIYPACGSYRNGVVIKLLKVEVYESKNIETPLEPLTSAQSEHIEWILDAELMSMKDPAVLSPIPNTTRDATKREKSSTFITARANVGACNGVHQWSLEFLDTFDAPFALGVISGSVPQKDSRLGTKQPIKTSDFPVEIAWHSDGSLWCDGVALAGNYGLSHLPLAKFSSVTLVINFVERHITFYVNGACLGVAFGAPGSGAAAVIENFPSESFEVSGLGSSSTYFPAASVFSTSISPTLTGSTPTIRIKCSGFHGSTTVPLILSIQKAAASTIGRISALFLLGPDVEKDEIALTPWLQSPLMIGGLEENEQNTAHSFDLLDWSSAIKNIGKELTITEDDSRKFVPDVSYGRNIQFQSDENDMLQSIVDAATSPTPSDNCKLFFGWLENIDPDSLKKAFEFNQCECLFTACLLKHGGLLSESISVVKSLRLDGQNQPKPSDEMTLLWLKVKQLRTYLRQRRQTFRASHFKSLNPSKLEPPISSDGASEGAPAQATDVLSSTENVLDSHDARLFYGNANIRWIEQLAKSENQDNDSISCHFSSLGIDDSNDSIFLHYCMKHVAPNASTLPSLLESELMIDGSSFCDPDQFISTDSTEERSGILRFDVPNLKEKYNSFSTKERLPLAMSICLPQWKPIIICLSSPSATEQDEKNESLTDVSLPEFDDLCNVICGKARLLLKMTPAVYAAEFNLRTSKTTLLGLTKKYSGNIPSSGSKTKERWKRVIEFLHRRSKESKASSEEENNLTAISERSLPPFEVEELNTLSISSTADDGKSPKSKPPFPPAFYCDKIDEDLSHSQAAIQACTVFITTEAVKIKEEGLIRILRRRLERADYRRFALDAMAFVCRLPEISDDPFSLFDILLFVRMAIAPFNSAADRTKEVYKNMNHYLTNLEGCSTSAMTAVQLSFVSLYNVLAKIFAKYSDSWEKHSIAASQGKDLYDMAGLIRINSKFAHILLIPLQLILDMWSLNFSNRDHRWVLESGFLSSLLKLSSIMKLEHALQAWLTAATELFDFSNKNTDADTRWQLWSPTYVCDGLLYRSVSCRSLLQHIAMTPETIISKQDRAALGIDMDFTALLKTFNSIPKVSMLFSQVAQRVKRQLAIEESKRTDEAAIDEAKNALKVKEMSERMALVGSFDPANKSEFIRLSEHNLTATLVLNETGNAVCCYATISYSKESIPTNGNYFEVEVLELGHGDIGIGLADRNTFRTSNQ